MPIQKSVLSVVLAGLLQIAIGCNTLLTGVYRGVTASREEGQVVEFSQLNFKVAHPGWPYIDMPADNINADADFAVMSLDPAIAFFVIAEEKEVEDYPTEALAKTVRQNLLQAAAGERSGVCSKALPYPVSGRLGLRFSCDLVVNKKRQHNTILVLSDKGYLYQLVAQSQVEDAERIETIADLLYLRFSLLDEQRPRKV